MTHLYLCLLVALGVLPGASYAAETGAAAAPSAVSAPAAEARPATLQSRLEALAAAHKGRVRFFAKDLATGETVALAADEPVRTASTIKLGVFLEAFHQVKEGRRRLDERVTVREDDKVAGSGVLPFLRAPLDLTLEDVLTLMMIESDNTATNLAIDRLGLAAVDARFAALGLKDTWLYKKVYKPAEGPMPPDQKVFGLGKSTAREMGRMLESVARCELGDKDLCAVMVRIMRNQQHRDMIPRYIETEDASEKGSIVADKTGALDAQRSDVGIVFSEPGPLVIAAFTDANEDQRWSCDNEGEVLVAGLAKAVYDEWALKKASR